MFVSAHKWIIIQIACCKTKEKNVIISVISIINVGGVRGTT